MAKHTAKAQRVYGASRGTRAIQTMVEHAPATGGLALWIRHVDLANDRMIPSCVANDGTTLFYAPRFTQLPLEEQVGWVAHQTLHVAFRHVQRRERLREVVGNVDATLYNACADALINSTLSHLEWLRLPSEAVYLEELVHHVFDEQKTSESLLLQWDVERLYNAIDDRRPTKGRGFRRSSLSQDDARAGQHGARQSPSHQRQSTQSTDYFGTRPLTPSEEEPTGDEEQSGDRFGSDGPRSEIVRALASRIAPDLLPVATSERPEDRVETTREWAERLSRGHAADGSFSMLRALSADLPKSRTPWAQVLRRSLTRALVREPSLSWSRPSRSWLANRGRTRRGRRLPWEPGTVTSKAVPKLVLVLDISGSIDDTLLQRFTTQLNGITRQSLAQVTLIAGDDRVRYETQIAPGALGTGSLPPMEGGGGTDFSPLIEAAARHRPDFVLVLTDLQGPANVKPAFPVLWAVPPDFAHVEPPFGRLLVLQD